MADATINRIQISQKGHFLRIEGCGPFFSLGDMASKLFYWLTLKESNLYFDNRRKRGFNLNYAVILAQFDRIKTPNVYGPIPLHDLISEKPIDGYKETDFFRSPSGGADRVLVLDGNSSRYPKPGIVLNEPCLNSNSRRNHV